MLSAELNSVHVYTLHRERNELIEHVTSLKIKLQEMSQREEDAYVQMKKGIELVEQAQLEETKVTMNLRHSPTSMLSYDCHSSLVFKTKSLTCNGIHFCSQV